MNGGVHPGDRLSTDVNVSTRVDAVRTADLVRTADMIRVASVPASHVYVRHLAQHMGTDVLTIRSPRMAVRFLAAGGLR